MLFVFEVVVVQVSSKSTLTSSVLVSDSSVCFDLYFLTLSFLFIDASNFIAPEVSKVVPTPLPITTASIPPGVQPVGSPSPVQQFSPLQQFSPIGQLLHRSHSASFKRLHSFFNYSSSLQVEQGRHTASFSLMHGYFCHSL